MGHNKKNANRGEAINRNAARVQELANKLKELGNIVKDAKRELQDEINEILVVIDEMDEETKERLGLLERPWWKKLLRMDLEVKEKEEEMPKGKVHRLEGHATIKTKKKDQPSTPSHRQVVVDRKTPGPKKRNGKPDKTKAESRDA